MSIDPPVSAVSELFAALRAAVGRMLLSWLLSSPTMDPDGEDGLHDVGGRRMQLIMRWNVLPHGLTGGSVAAAARLRLGDGDLCLRRCSFAAQHSQPRPVAQVWLTDAERFRPSSKALFASLARAFE